MGAKPIRLIINGTDRMAHLQMTVESDNIKNNYCIHTKKT